jgi:hypothetical protein
MMLLMLKEVKLIPLYGVQILSQFRPLPSANLTTRPGFLARWLRDQVNERKED